MIYKRQGRKNDEMRPMEAKVGVIKNAQGSAYFKTGNTMAFAAVYGPRELYPQFLQNAERGVLRCNYNMVAFSGSGDRVRPGPSRRSKEISLITEKALMPVVDLSAFPGTVVDVFIELFQTDAGTRCAGITAAAMALADAGIPMKDMVCALAAGMVEGQPLIDLDYEEDSHENGVDLPVAICSRTGRVSLLQMDGEISKERMIKVLEMAQKSCVEINKIQVEALKAKYGRSDENE